MGKKNHPLHDFDGLSETVRGLVVDLGKTFKDPDDDWMPVLFILSGRGELTVAQFMQPHEGGKDAMAEAMGQVVRERRARLVAMVQSAWFVEVNPDATDEQKAAGERSRLTRGLTDSYEDIMGIAPSEHPDRVEAVVVNITTKERSELWKANIKRDGVHPPTLDEWTKWPGSSHESIMGRFPEAILNAMLPLNQG